MLASVGMKNEFSRFKEREKWGENQICNRKLVKRAGLPTSTHKQQLFGLYIAIQALDKLI